MKLAFYSEQAVLGALLNDPTTLSRVRTLLPSPESFGHEHHRMVWAAAIGLEADGEPIDLITLAERLAASGRLEEVGGTAYLGGLMSSSPSAANVESHASSVAKEASRRHYKHLTDTARKRLNNDDPAVVIGELQAAIGRAEVNGARTTYVTLDMVDIGFAALASSEQHLLPTGLAPLDNMLGGLEQDRLYAVAALTGGGKTAMLYAMLHHIANQGHPVGLCSLEMPVGEVFNRLAAHRYGLNLSALTRRHGDIARQLDDAYQKDPMSMLDLYVDDTSEDLSAIVARAMEWHYRYGIKAVFIDYIGLVRVKGSAPRHEKIGECSRAFKSLSKRLHIPVIVACQLNREAAREERKPRKSDLRDSGSIEQDSDAIIALHPTSEPDRFGRRTIDIGVIKNRAGSTGWLNESITFDGRTQRFEFSGGSDRGGRY